MNNRINILVLALCFPFFMNGQSKIKGNGNIISKNITTSSYDKINVNGFFDVELIAGEEGKITLKAEENLVDYIQIEVENNTLKIKVEKGIRLIPSHGKKVLITVPFESLNEVSLAGSGDVTTKNPITAKDFKSTLSGSGDVSLEVNAKEINSEVSGSGDMTLKGKSDVFNGSVIGSGDMNAKDLQSATVTAKVTGSGDCKVYCTDSLEARVVGSGDIQYYGNPKKKDTKVAGSGDITKG